MRIEDFEREYQIREFQVKSQRLQTELSWKFKSASHFLVFIYDDRWYLAKFPGDMHPHIAFAACGKKRGLRTRRLPQEKRRPTCIPEKMESSSYIVSGRRSLYRTKRP